MAIRFDVEQGSLDWLQLRAGRPTSSEFKRIITPSTGQYSKSADDYQNELVGELITGQADENRHSSWAMETGKILEAEAVRQYEFINDVETERAGFWTDDTKRYGASPDRLVGNNGLVEVKCKFLIKDQMAYLFSDEIENDHRPQIQGQLLTCEREFCDWWIFHQSLPPAHRRVYRDEDYITKLKAGLDRFLEELNTKVEIAIKKGWIEIKKEAVNA